MFYLSGICGFCRGRSAEKFQILQGLTGLLVTLIQCCWILPLLSLAWRPDLRSQVMDPRINSVALDCRGCRQDYCVWPFLKKAEGR